MAQSFASEAMHVIPRAASLSLRSSDLVASTVQRCTRALAMQALGMEALALGAFVLLLLLLMLVIEALPAESAAQGLVAECR